MLAKFGFGSAKIETVIHTNEIQPLGVLIGHFKITGGKLGQHIETIKIDILTKMALKSMQKGRRRFATVQSLTFEANRTVDTDVEITIPFRFILHGETPVTEFKSSRPNDVEVFLKSSLEIAYAINPIAVISLSVHPTNCIPATS